jgi:curved DNA-binding protein CbpA
VAPEPPGADAGLAVAAVAENHYTTLGLWFDASDDDVRKAYRRLVLVHHPDRNGGDPEASVRFRAVQEAYDVLGRPAQRTWYDASLRPVELPPRPEAERPLPAEREGPADQASRRSMVALSFGLGAELCLLVGVVQTFGVYALAPKGWIALRFAAVCAALVASQLGKRELNAFQRLQGLYSFGVHRVTELPPLSPASRGAARAARLLARTVPLGFLLLVVAQILRMIQSGSGPLFLR